ncbi:hypothetical protein QJS04_geneDACA003032 [Acorus gramineus]|uniref:Adenylate isopentenyltransferase n=1 Tax=Acorus gramineus TaxID=55184 RepID=A0AAV9BWW9_ACOGR|nr:hypothetical protein QJS04_geneDACA003032 [Acorus gramineus]
MRLSLCSRARSVRPFRWSPNAPDHHRRRRLSLLVIMGATGTGKSRLSIDVASRFPSEVINADKIQLYRGLDITTNKIPLRDRRSVPHHLLGDADPSAGELSPISFRSLAASAAASIASRSRLPVIAGGSNSLLHSLLSDRFDPLTPLGYDFRSPVRLRFNCCFLWVDVREPVLSEQLDRRVDDMLGLGMFEELAGYIGTPEARAESGRNVGLNRAIGVPEFERYFRRFGSAVANPETDVAARAGYEEAVREIKENTRRLAEAQREKIVKLGSSGGWRLNRVDATEAVRAGLEGEPDRFREAWDRDVLRPGLKVVKRFLDESAFENNTFY